MKRYLLRFRALGLAAVLMPALFCCARLQAAGAEETKAFRDARNLFDGGWWERAEVQFSDFVQKFPNSERRAEAVLLQAEARLQSRHHGAAISLLSAELPRAGALADQYNFWMGKAQFESRNFPAAADSYARVLKDFPAATPDLRLKAALGEAESRSKLADWPRIVSLLQDPAGVFQQIARTRPNDELVLTGTLLLGKAQLAQKDFAAAEATLRQLAQLKLSPDWEWRRAYLLTQVQLGAGRDEEALAGSTNLVKLSEEMRNAALQAESAGFQAEILEHMDRLPEAVAAYGAYEAKFGKELPAEKRRQAVLRMVELNLRQGKADAAAKELEEFLAKNPEEKTSDLALLTLGEIDLKRYFQSRSIAAAVGSGMADAGTNFLQQAQASFEKLLGAYTNSVYGGKARLNLGWCQLEQGNLPRGEAAFAGAVDSLPFSEDQAVARFKLADVQYQQNRLDAAISNYDQVVSNYTSLPAVQNELVEQALYQTMRAALARTNLDVAATAVKRLLELYPNGSLGAPAMLLHGQGVSQQGGPARAREDLSHFASRTADLSLLPEVQLAIARTYETEGDWTNAIVRYESWLAAYTNSPAKPRAEFGRAWANFQAGRETNALVLFTNFVAQFPTNDLAPLAQFWVADHYFRNEEFVPAELNYQEVFKKWPASPLADQARMMAGRAAVAREGIGDAMQYFTQFATNYSSATKTDLVWSAQYAYADALMMQPSKDAKNPGANFREAIQRFQDLAKEAASNGIAPLAIGRIGDCHFQLAELERTNSLNEYAQASNAYHLVVTAELADIFARSQAEVKLARTLEKMAALAASAADRKAFLEGALSNCLNVVYGANLRAGETQNLFWVKEAGLDAGRLAEDSGQWPQAVQLYDRLRKLLPSLQNQLDKKYAKAQERLLAEKRPGVE